jgi:hypothetical protein
MLKLNIAASVQEGRGYGLDNSDSRRDLHRPGNQRLSAGRDLIVFSFWNERRLPGRQQAAREAVISTASI